MYKKAIFEKIRFVTPKGELSTEQLATSCTMTFVANVVRELNKELKKNDTDGLSFLDNTNVVDKTLQLKFEIAKDIYLTLKAQQEAISNERAIKEEEQRLLALIKNKKETVEKDLPLEELEAKLKALRS